MLNLFQHLFIKRFRNEFGMTLYWITSSFCCLGLFVIEQKHGFAQSNGLDTTCRHPTKNSLCGQRNEALKLNKLNLFYRSFASIYTVT